MKKKNVQDMKVGIESIKKTQTEGQVEMKNLNLEHECWRPTSLTQYKCQKSLRH